VLFKQWPDIGVGTKFTSLFLRYTWTTYN